MDSAWEGKGDGEERRFFHRRVFSPCQGQGASHFESRSSNPRFCSAEGGREGGREMPGQRGDGGDGRCCCRAKDVRIDGVKEGEGHCLELIPNDNEFRHIPAAGM